MSNSARVKSDIKIKVIPRSSLNQITGKEGDAFKIKLTSPPVAGKANKVLIEILSKKLGISKGSIEIISGRTSRRKTLRVHGLSPEDISLMLIN